MFCEQFEQYLGQQDGPLPVEAAAHLETCSGCRLLQEDLREIEIAAKEWGSDEPAPPPHVWAAIQARLESQGLIARPALPPQSRGWLAGWRDFAPRLEMVGAYVLILLVAAGLAGYRTIPSSSPLDRSAGTEQISRPALDGIGPALDGNMQRVVATFSGSDYDNSVALSLQQNLQIVDNLIAVCEKTVREHPGDPLAREYLYGAYQQKADLLAVAMDRSALETK